MEIKITEHELPEQETDWRDLADLCQDVMEADANRELNEHIQKLTGADYDYTDSMEWVMELPGLKYLHAVETLVGGWNVEVGLTEDGIGGVGTSDWLPLAICIAWLNWQDNLKQQSG